MGKIRACDILDENPDTDKTDQSEVKVKLDGVSCALQGASETRVPFLARTTAMVSFLLDWGAAAAYWGVALSNAWMAVVVVAGFHYGDWAERAAGMMAEREAATEE